MQRMMIYWQSVVPQHVSGVFTPIVRRADCVSLPMVFYPGCRCCGSGESRSEMCALGHIMKMTVVSPKLYHETMKIICMP